MTEEIQIRGYKWWQWVLGALCVLPLIPMLIGVIVPKTRRILTPLVIWIGYAVLLVVFIVVSASSSESDQSTSDAQVRQNTQDTQTAATEPTPEPTIATEPTPEPKVSLNPGMYQVGSGIAPGVSDEMNAKSCADNPQACLTHYYDKVVEECVPEALNDVYASGFEWKDEATKSMPFDVGAVDARPSTTAGQGYSARTRVEYLGYVGTSLDILRDGQRIDRYMYCGYDLRDSDFVLGGATLKDLEGYRQTRQLLGGRWLPLRPENP